MTYVWWLAPGCKCMELAGVYIYICIYSMYIAFKVKVRKSMYSFHSLQEP